MSNITFGTLPPSLTTQLRTNQKTAFFWGNVASRDMEKAGFLLQKAVQEQSYGPPPPPPLGNLGKRGSVSSLIGGSLKTRQMFFFPKKIEAGFEMNPAVFPRNNLLGFLMFGWNLEVVKDVALKKFCVSFLLQWFRDVLTAVQCAGFLRDLIPSIRDLLEPPDVFIFYLNCQNSAGKTDQQKSKLFQKQQPKTPINMMISQWKIQPSTKNSFPADPCGNNEGENTQGRLQEQRLRRLRGKGAECRAQGDKIENLSHFMMWHFMWLFPIGSIYYLYLFFWIILHLCSFYPFLFLLLFKVGWSNFCKIPVSHMGGPGLCPDPKPLHPTIQSAVAGRREHPVRVTKKSLGDFIWAFP